MQMISLEQQGKKNMHDEPAFDPGLTRSRERHSTNWAITPSTPMSKGAAHLLKRGKINLLSVY